MPPRRYPIPSWFKKASHYVQSCSGKTIGSSSEKDKDVDEQENSIACYANFICPHGIPIGAIYKRFVNSTEKSDYDYVHRMEAYLNVMTLAREAGFWAEDVPRLDTIIDVVNAFLAPPPPGKKIELSFASAVVPGIELADMIRIMKNVRDQWSSSLFPIVTKREEYCVPVNPNWRDPPVGAGFGPGVEMHAAMQLPSALVSTRYFEFLRFSKKIADGLYIFVDFSSRNFASSFASSNCIRRPSGVIIRANTGEPEGCEIMWIENVEVDETREDNIYSGIINSNSAFGAQRCINTLLQKLKRDKSEFGDAIITVAPTAYSFLLALTNAMKRFFMECVSQHPCENVVTVKSSAEDPIRILHNKTTTEDLTFVGVTSFRVHAKPLLVFNFLMKKDIQLEYRKFAYSRNESGKVNEDLEQTDEVREEPEQTDEIREEPEQTDEIREEPEQTDEIHKESEHADEVHREPEKTDEVHGEPEKTDEVHGEPEKTDEVHGEPEKTYAVHGEPEKTDEVHGEPEKTDEVHGEPEKTDEICGEPEQTDEIREEPERTNEIHEVPEQTNEIHEVPERTNEIREEPEQTDDFRDEPERTNEIQEVPEQTNEIQEEPEQINEIQEEPEKSNKQTNKEPELVFTFGTDDKSNIISLHRGKIDKLVYTYILQEASMDAYCSFILSKTLDEESAEGHIIRGLKSIYEEDEMRVDNMTPIGFAIMPDGPGELECDACLVTVLMQIYYDPSLTDVNIESVRNEFELKFNNIIEELNEKVVEEEGKKTELFKASSEPGNL